MTMRYKVWPNEAVARAQADALWTAYAQEQRTLRGLPDGASLDALMGRTVDAVTVRYCVPVTASGETRAAVPIDDAELALNGRRAGAVTVDVAGAVAADELPTALRQRLASGEAAAAQEGAARRDGR